MLFYIIFDLSMACITFGFGLWFYKSNGCVSHMENI